MAYTGRRKIFTRFRAITPENVVEVINETKSIHIQNREEIRYLWMYYRGYQDILGREKKVRPEICNNVVVNRANEIVSFKSSYFLGSPIQYIGRGEANPTEINRLNDAMYSEDKDSKDKEIVDWMHICGVAYRMVLPDTLGEEDGSPANILTLDPQNVYTIYSRDKGNPLLGAVLVRENELRQEVYEVYTKDYYFEVSESKVGALPNTLKSVPIIEYVNNEARMGAFEVVLPILNALNTLESNRTDGVEDFVNAYDVFQNCEIDEETYKGLTAGGMAINIKSQPGLDSKVYRIASELNQTGVQTAIDDLYDAVLGICGMPNRNGGSSTSDTGQAVLYRDGWSEAESRAKDTESLFKRAERQFLRVFLKICNGTSAADNRQIINLSINQIDVKCPRRNAANVQSKAQTLTTLLGSDLVHPLKAYEACDIWADTTEAYTMGMAWHDEQQAVLEKTLQEELNRDVSDSGQSDSNAESENDTAVQPNEADATKD